MLARDRARRRLAGQTLRLGGLGLMLLSLVALAGQDGPAYAAILAPLREAGVLVAQATQQEQTTTVIFTPSPGPTPTPSPIPGSVIPVQGSLAGYHMGHGGPVKFSFTGSITGGTQSRSNTVTGGNIFSPIGSSPSPSPTGSNQPPFLASQTQTTNASQGAVTANAEITRRTATTFTDVRLPIGYASAGGQVFGQAVAIYSTPRYSVAYTSQNLTAFGQLPLGSTLRGLEFILPSRLGQEIFYEGVANGAQGDIDRLIGVLAQATVGQTYYELGATLGRGDFTGKSATYEFGAATGHGNFSVVGEGAYQFRDCSIAAPVPPGQTGCDGSPHGPAFQIRFDDGSTTGGSGWQLTLRDVPEKFVAYGAGEINGDKYGDVNFHAGQTTAMFLDANWEKFGDGQGGTTTQTTESLGLTGGGRLGGYSLSLGQLGSKTVSGGIATVIDTTQAQISIQPRLTFAQAVFGAQLQRSIDGGAPSSTETYAGSFSRQFGLFNVQLFLQDQHQTQEGVGPTTLNGVSFAIARQFGKASFGLSNTITHTISPTSDATVTTPLVNVTRIISPALSVGTSFGYQKTVDRLNPSADGHSRIFTIQLNAPFQLGNNLTTGRVDPRLPATISGRVQTVASSTQNPSLASFATLNATGGGLGNVAVVLDDREVERTDLTGGFQFAFISPGQHQLRLESSSLPRGVTVATPIATVVVQGGQNANVVFQVGTFGGVIGHIYGMDSTGNKLPLQNVQLRIDGGAYSITDISGAYGFGGLSAGTHTVEVIENSIPAFASFDPKSLSRKVQVNNGSYTTIDFSAEPLGSIAGRITYAADVENDGFTGPVPNAYVVAEPGEHAAIDTDDGSFIIDNLPAGDYTVSVDNETLENNFGGGPESIAVHLGPGEHYDGAIFTVGRFEKKVVFSLLNGTGSTAAPILHLAERKLPPMGTSEVTLGAPAGAKGVFVTAFGTRTALKYDKDRNLWVGEIEVPDGTKGGNYSITASLASGVPPTSASLTVDPKMPLAIVTSNPSTGANGLIARVHIRFLVDVSEGDVIEWEDGTRTVLGKPVAPRVFTFSLRVSLRPLHGVLLTKQRRIPIELL